MALSYLAAGYRLGPDAVEPAEPEHAVGVIVGGSAPGGAAALWGREPLLSNR